MRSTRWCSAGSVQNVSCMVRAGWSGPRLRASKLSHSASTTGPSATSQPIATNTSAMSLGHHRDRVAGAARCAVPREGDVDGLLDQHPLLGLGLEHGLARSASAWLTAPRAWPTRWPASLRACGGSAPISRLASASGERSPAWSVRTCLSASRSVAAAIAARASSRIASTCSSSSGVTWTGSYSEFGPDMGAFRCVGCGAGQSRNATRAKSASRRASGPRTGPRPAQPARSRERRPA